MWSLWLLDFSPSGLSFLAKPSARSGLPAERLPTAGLRASPLVPGKAVASPRFRSSYTRCVSSQVGAQCPPGCVSSQVGAQSPPAPDMDFQSARSISLRSLSFPSAPGFVVSGIRVDVRLSGLRLVLASALAESPGSAEPWLRPLLTPVVFGDVLALVPLLFLRT